MGDYVTGQNAVCLLSTTPETEFGKVIPSVNWQVFGIVSSAEANRSTDTNKIYGLGQKAAQAEYAGAVENTLRVDCVAPSKAILRTALPNVNQEINSYNFAIGKSGDSGKGVGLKWNQMTINVPEEEPLSVSFDGIFKSWLVPAGSATGFDIEKQLIANPILWKRTGLTLRIGGVIDNDLMSLEITVNNNITRKGVDNSISNQQRTAKVLEDGNFEVDARVMTYTRPIGINLEESGYGCSTGNITMEATFVNECSTASSPETLVITLGNGIYKSVNESYNANEIVQYEIGIQFRTMTIT